MGHAIEIVAGVVSCLVLGVIVAMLALVLLT